MNYLHSLIFSFFNSWVFRLWILYLIIIVTYQDEILCSQEESVEFWVTLFPHNLSKDITAVLHFFERKCWISANSSTERNWSFWNEESMFYSQFCTFRNYLAFLPVSMFWGYPLLISSLWNTLLINPSSSFPVSMPPLCVIGIVYSFPSSSFSSLCWFPPCPSFYHWLWFLPFSL